MTQIIEYLDPATETRGWLAYHGHSSPLAAGGCRVQAGLHSGQLATLAQRMSLKQRVLGLNVDGAKSGLDLDPGSDRKAAALANFLAFLGDELRTRYSMGADMGTEWHELHEHARGAGVPSIKYAIRTAQGLSDAEFFLRMATLEDRTGLLTLSQLRAGHALAHAALAAARVAGSTGRVPVALQGFGNLGRGAAYALAEEGARVVAVADEHGTLADAAGLDVAGLLLHPRRTAVPRMTGRATTASLFDLTADVLVLAAGSDAMTCEQAATAQFGVVAVGANCGLSEAAEATLYTRGVFVVPDFIGGLGGSAAMEALFGPATPPSAQQVLHNLTRLMRELVDDIAHEARGGRISPRHAALRLAEATAVDPDARPYGHCRYLTTYSS
jgi:glutamate dehydrogenase/leucine dehydrogenase